MIDGILSGLGGRGNAGEGRAWQARKAREKETKQGERNVCMYVCMYSFKTHRMDSDHLDYLNGSGSYVDRELDRRYGSTIKQGAV
jgi:hypothetical protein